jgi:hypothetical protein
LAAGADYRQIEPVTEYLPAHPLLDYRNFKIVDHRQGLWITIDLVSSLLFVVRCGFEG